MAVDEPLALALPGFPRWHEARRTAALAVMAPNDKRVAAAAAQLLTLDDSPAAFAAWCDAIPQA